MKTGVTTTKQTMKHVLKNTTDSGVVSGILLTVTVSLSVSRIIAPALQQAVESNVAELEEATFGRGKWFDVSDNLGDTERQDVMFLRNKLTEDFEDCKVRKAVAECLINSAVFGEGIGEIVIEEMKEMAPATQPIMGGDLQAVGVNITERVKVKA